IYPLQFDLLKDFEPIALIATQPSLIVARKTMPANDLKELIAWLKVNADKATQGNSGIGTPSHVGGILFQNSIGVRVQLVPYRSAGLTMQGLLTGDIDIALDTPALSVSQVRAGNIKAYAVTANRRLQLAPEIPTTDEAGLPGFYFSFWHGLWSPEGAARDALAKLSDAVVKSLADPAVRNRLIELAQERAADPGGAWRLSEGRNREVVANHQGCRHQGGMKRRVCRHFREQRYETFPSKFSAFGRGRCRAAGRRADRYGAILSDAAGASDRAIRGRLRH